MDLRINLKRGLVRIWVGISGLWIAFCGMMAFFDPPRSDQLAGVAAVVLGPPVVLFILGRAAAWILQGFRQSPE